jgi:hypothetical protein
MQEIETINQKIAPLEEISLPQGKTIERVNFLPVKEKSTLKDGQIGITEMMIDYGIDPDIAYIEARTDTPIQRYEGDGEMIDVFLDSGKVVEEFSEGEKKYSIGERSPVGVILMSPNGDIELKYFDPREHGGARGYKITRGWTVQTIVPDGSILKFYDYWSPRGFASLNDDGEQYGNTVVIEVEDSEVVEKFKHAREQIIEFFNS